MVSATMVKKNSIYHGKYHGKYHGMFIVQNVL